MMNECESLQIDYNNLENITNENDMCIRIVNINGIDTIINKDVKYIHISYHQEYNAIKIYSDSLITCEITQNKCIINSSIMQNCFMFNCCLNNKGKNTWYFQNNNILIKNIILNGSGTLSINVPNKLLTDNFIKYILHGNGYIYINDIFIKNIKTILIGSGRILFNSCECNIFDAILIGSGEIRGPLITNIFSCEINGSGRIIYNCDSNNNNISITNKINGSGNAFINYI